MTVYEKLSRLDTLPMHMPGHKRNTDAFPWLAGLAERDITEIPGFDDLNDPEEGFAAMEQEAARLWGAAESVALAGGSTLGILACVLSALEGGGEMLMCRASHRSVYHAAQLLGVHTRYLVPASDPGFGIPLSVTPEEVAGALDRYPNVRLVCVTSPTYEGVLSDTAGIARECHRHGVPLLVDEAHGAHLGFSGFPQSSVAGGADLVVQSLHKTLPALTQTAVLHMNRGLADTEKARRYVSMLQTSSPSYLLSTSIERCVEYISLRGSQAAARWLEELAEFRAGAEELRNIRLFRGGQGVFRLDPSKLLLSGAGLGECLRREHRIEPEYVRGDLTLCMTGLGDTRETLTRLLDALIRLDSRTVPASAPPLPSPALPEQVMTVGEAMRAPGRPLSLREALGHVSGEYAWHYPPGVPCLVPGERVDEGVLETILRANALHFTRKHGPDRIFCVDLPGKMV